MAQKLVLKCKLKDHWNLDILNLRLGERMTFEKLELQIKPYYIWMHEKFDESILPMIKYHIEHNIQFDPECRIGYAFIFPEGKFFSIGSFSSDGAFYKRRKIFDFQIGSFNDYRRFPFESVLRAYEENLFSNLCANNSNIDVVISEYLERHKDKLGRRKRRH